MFFELIGPFFTRLAVKKANNPFTLSKDFKTIKEAAMKSTRSWTKFFVFSLLFLIPSVAFADLTGRWNCNDGGQYYVRQLGKEVFWYGEKSANNPSWSNVASGYVDGNSIILRWADVPKGSIMQEGILILQIDNPNRFHSVKKTGGFGGSIWERP